LSKKSHRNHTEPSQSHCIFVNTINNNKSNFVHKKRKAYVANKFYLSQIKNLKYNAGKREEKILDLKKEITKLKSIIGQQERYLIDNELLTKDIELENIILKEEVERYKRKAKKLKKKRRSSLLTEDEQNVVTNTNSNMTNLQVLIDEPSSDNIDLELLEYANPDEMTYEELLELGDKIGYIDRGFKQEEIDFMPVIKYSSKKSIIYNINSMCTICQYEFSHREKLRQFSCFHSFHVRCVDDWLRKRKECPNCMEEIHL
jgi:hypothetical protein